MAATYWDSPGQICNSLWNEAPLSSEASTLMLTRAVEDLGPAYS
jgi:hypothetical protein